jgi:ankyrin repeat protein
MPLLCITACLCSKDGYCPLHVAAKAGHLQMAQLLVDSGADVNVSTK